MSSEGLDRHRFHSWNQFGTPEVAGGRHSATYLPRLVDFSLDHEYCVGIARQDNVKRRVPGRTQVTARPSRRPDDSVARTFSGIYRGPIPGRPTRSEWLVNVRISERDGSSLEKRR